MIKNKKVIFQKVLCYIALVLLASLIIFPFYIVLVTSFKTWKEAASVPFTFIPKEGFTLTGYVNVFTYKSGMDTMSTVVRGFINTIITTVPPTLVGLFASALSAFAFAKMRFRMKKLFFSILIGTMMIPGTVLIAPHYMLYNLISWVDTFLPLIIPGLFGSATCVFFMRQFFFAIPDSLIEAARIDGMGWGGCFIKIVLPLAVPAFLAQGIIGFIGGYNAYLGPLIYLQSNELYTLQIALNFFQSTITYDWPTVMAGAIISLVPLLLIYVFCQRFFIEGIATTGMKL